MTDKTKDFKSILLLRVFAVVLTVVFIVLIAFVFSTLEKYYSRLDTAGDDDYAYRSNGRPEYLVDGKWYIGKENVETFLLIGIDKYEAAIQNKDGYRNSQQSDALFLLAIDHDSKSYSIIHINRDTLANIRMLDLNGNPYNTFEGQLAISHTYGSGREDSCENTVWSVSDYLYGLQIDHYASISMDAVAVLNDKIGGVTLTVLDDMTNVDEQLVEGASVTLTGEHALHYVRARKGLADSTNVERMKRQKQYVAAFIEQAKASLQENSALAPDILLSISEYLVSDMRAEDLLSITDVIQNYRFDGVQTIEGEARKGEQYMEFRADEAPLKELILRMFYEPKSK
ncbi:MAG: LCP family protein [Eubacteriales bacterium]|nr:LCP family protein [Eubacteriales bacterium]